jgi:hypothetical protein
MQAKCPKCDGTAFRMLPESPKVTEVECQTCGYVAPFVSTVAPQTNRRLASQQVADGE